MKKVIELTIVCALAFFASAPSMGETVTYAVSGTFTDGGTFSGTFEYDRAANSYQIENPSGAFNIVTTSGNQVSGRQYLPAPTINGGYNDVNSSTPNTLYIDGCCNEGITNLILDWNTPLDNSGGAVAQAITGGSETSQPFTMFPAQTRQVAGGVIEVDSPTVPLPASIWLMLSGVIGLLTSFHHTKGKRFLVSVG